MGSDIYSIAVVSHSFISKHSEYGLILLFIRLLPLTHSCTLNSFQKVKALVQNSTKPDNL